jgi:hypothetical protein
MIVPVISRSGNAAVATVANRLRTAAPTSFFEIIDSSVCVWVEKRSLNYLCVVSNKPA